MLSEEFDPSNTKACRPYGTFCSVRRSDGSLAKQELVYLLKPLVLLSLLRNNLDLSRHFFHLSSYAVGILGGIYLLAKTYQFRGNG